MRGVIHTWRVMQISCYVQDKWEANAVRSGLVSWTRGTQYSSLTLAISAIWWKNNKSQQGKNDEGYVFLLNNLWGPLLPWVCLVALLNSLGSCDNLSKSWDGLLPSKMPSPADFIGNFFMSKTVRIHPKKRAQKPNVRVSVEKGYLEGDLPKRVTLSKTSIVVIHFCVCVYRKRG